MHENNVVIRNIKLKEEECIDKLINICGTLNINIEKIDDSKISSFLLKDDSDSIGLIRIFRREKNKTITLDGSGKDKGVNSKVLEVFHEKYVKKSEDSAERPAKCAVYDVTTEQFDDIREVIEKRAERNGYKITVNNSNALHIYYLESVIDENSGDKAVITQFTSGKLTIQGKSWNVWDEVCNVVDEKLNSSVTDLFVRFASGAISNNALEEIAATTSEPDKVMSVCEHNSDLVSMEENKAACVTNIITESLKTDGENAIKSRLGKVYDNLYYHDKILITSSQCMLLSKIDFGDFYCYVAPSLRVVDGYLKKMLIDLNLLTETEINSSPNFNYGSVFHGIEYIIRDKKDKLNNIKTTKDQKEKALIEIYKLYKSTRNPLQHDGPPIVKMVPTYEDAESEIDNIISTFKSTFEVLF